MVDAVIQKRKGGARHEEIFAGLHRNWIRFCDCRFRNAFRRACTRRDKVLRFRVPSLKQIDALDQKVGALERTLDALTIEANKSIKSGQKIILHTDPSIRGGGCLTPNGPSGDLGGFVEWSVNCSQGTSWVIK
jgi:hypothetical protein